MRVKFTMFNAITAYACWGYPAIAIYPTIILAFPLVSYSQPTNPPNAKELFNLTDSRYYAKRVYFTFDNRSVAVSDKLAGDIVIFDIHNWSIKKAIECGGNPGRCAISNDGLSMAVELKGGILIMNTDNPFKPRWAAIPNLIAVDRITFDSTSGIVCCIIAKDVSLRDRIAVATTVIRINVQTGKLVSEFRLPKNHGVDDVAPDWSTAVLRNWSDNTLRLFDVGNGRVIKDLRANGLSRYSHNDKSLFIYSQESIVELLPSTGDVVKRTVLENRLAIPYSRSAFDVYSSGKLLVYASGEQGKSNVALIVDASSGVVRDIIKCYDDGVDIIGVQVNRDETILCTTRAINNHKDKYIGPSIKFWRIP